jgi:hypothetical protein
MHTRLSDIIRKGRLAAVLVPLTMLTGLSCLAQDSGRLPDSIRTETDSLTTAATTTIGTVEPPAVTDSSSVTDSVKSDASSSPAYIATLRQVPDSVIIRLNRDKDFAYANDPSYWIREGSQSGKGKKGKRGNKGGKENDKNDNNNNNSNDDDSGSFLDKFVMSGGFKFFLYLLLGGVLLFALYKIIAGNNLHLFYRGPRKIPGGKDPEDVADMDEGDLERKIQEALRAGDHRTAVRYLFLKTLRLLNEKQLIVYHPQATNQEYIGQMRSLPQGKNFLFLAHAYEYIWYGDFPLSRDQFGQVENKFQDFYKEINAR